MQKWFAAVVVVALALTASAQDRGGGAPPAQRRWWPTGPGRWTRCASTSGRRQWDRSRRLVARLDDPKESRTGLRFVTMDKGLRATTGPTVILYDPEEDWEGPYTTKATLTMTKPASHEVAYRLFVGGQDLDTDKQRYTYFVIRQDGKFLIRKRTGATTANVAGDWTDHAAIQKPNAQGSQTNALAIGVGRDTVTFTVNGQTVPPNPPRRWTSSGSPDCVSGTASTYRSTGSPSNRRSSGRGAGRRRQRLLQ